MSLTEKDQSALNRLREAIGRASICYRHFGSGDWRSREARERLDQEALEHVRKRLEDTL